MLCEKEKLEQSEGHWGGNIDTKMARCGFILKVKICSRLEEVRNLVMEIQEYLEYSTKRGGWGQETEWPVWVESSEQREQQGIRSRIGMSKHG